MKNTLLNYSDHPVRQWFIRQSLDRPIRVIILSVIATIIMGFGLQFFVVDDDVMKMLPKNLESRLSWDALQDEFGSTEMIFIAFGHKNKTIFTTLTITIC